MPGIQDLIAPQGMPPQGVPQPQGGPPGPQGNPLAALAAQQQAPPPPAPTRAQTIAAVHHFGQVKQAFSPIIDDPNLGQKNIRPKVMDAMSKLLGSKTLSLPDVMKAIKNLPEDPMEQKKFVDGIYQKNDQAQKMVLAQHAAAPDNGQPQEDWSSDSHANHMAGLMQNYAGAQNGRG